MELHNIYPLRSLPYLAYDNVNPAMVISMMLRSSMPAFEKVYSSHTSGGDNLKRFLVCLKICIIFFLAYYSI